MLIPGRYYKRLPHYNTAWYTEEKCYRAMDVDTMISNKGPDRSFREDYFELQEEPKSEPEENQMDYKFNVSSDKLIDLNEIQECLTRKNPVCIVHRSDGMHTVLFHDSIWKKLDVIESSISDQFEAAVDPYYALPDNYVPTTRGCLTPVMNAVRAVKEAKVIVGNRCEVKVVFPEI